MSRKTAVQRLVGDMLTAWAGSDSYSSAPAEGSMPELARRLGTRQEELTFDNFFHSQSVPGWSWRTLEFSEVFKGAFFLYLPDKWGEIKHRKNAANVLEGDKIKQSMFILDKQNWAKSLPAFLNECDIDGFAYYPLLVPAYHQWVICTHDPKRDIGWVYAIYSAGDWVFVTKGDAPNQTMLETQLISMTNTNPWYGWIQAAKGHAGAQT